MIKNDLREFIKNSTRRNNYEFLGLPSGATEEEIKKAYKVLARKYHPDVSKEEDAEAKFKELNKAYTALSDPGQRINTVRKPTKQEKKAEKKMRTAEKVKGD